MSEQKKPAVEAQTRDPQELDEQQLEGVAGGLGIAIRFTLGHTVYEASAGYSSNSSAGFYGSVRGIAST